jgi:GH15 family glucan-1,4-alpha-glucosidase
VRRPRPAQLDHAEGAHLCADGGIVAAPTTSLPEELGGRAQLGLPLLLGARRDAHAPVPLYAGYLEEARAWRDWLLRAVAGSPREMQIMYGPAGERRLTELELDWLPGYEGAAPVRIGNAAVRPVPARRLRRADGRACCTARQAA